MNHSENSFIDRTTPRPCGYVTTPEIARFAGLHPTTLVKWRNRRVGPPFTRLGRKVLYSLEAFDVWLRDSEQEPLTK